MIKYNVYWKEQSIGILTIEEDWYKYIPDDGVIKKLQGQAAFLVAQVTKEYEGKPIQFFKQLIDNCSRFEGRELMYHNNNYWLKCD